ncbi:MAG: DUF4041 domain-containing protein [Proteobacteria bacterium]|nr:DUF4041 domain-containing protein [Pseudomonadota bacterium]
MDSTTMLVAILIAVFALSLLIFYLKVWKERNQLRGKYGDLIDVEEEQKVLEDRRDSFLAEFELEMEKLRSEEARLKAEYMQKRNLFESLTREISIVEEHLDYISFGIYEPHFDFDTSEKYKARVKEVRERQKQVIRSKDAAVCDTEWSVHGSRAEGRKMTNRNIRLILRAFNSECDASVMKAKWNNIRQLEERIKKAYIALNKLGEPSQIAITDKYLRLKLEELHLAHEYREKLYQEREEQRQVREQMREEARVQKEIEKAQKEAEEEESRYMKALEQAKGELAGAHGDDIARLEEQTRQLEEKLREAHESKDRAMSRAQLTKAGHVYVISNVGSFGEDVYKIGMTRRLEPLDRVKELGDASVPFSFDVHAMIYSENAPELEATLHNTLSEKRLNLVNPRKEFYSVTLGEVEAAVPVDAGEIELTRLAEAREYRESLSIKKTAVGEAIAKLTLEERFPTEL